MQLADPQSAGEVVHPHRRAEEPRDAPGEQAVTCEDREQEGQHAHEVRRGLAEHLALGQRLVDEPDLALLEVADPAVHELRRLRRGARCDVVALDQRGAQAPRGGVERDAGAGDPAADDEHVEVLVGQAAERGRAVEAHPGNLPGGAQMTSPGVPSSRTTGRPCAAQAFMPPAMFAALKPQCDQALRSPWALRTPERHTHTMRRFIGSWNRAASSSPSGTHCAPGRVAGLPLVGFAHVEQHVLHAARSRVDGRRPRGSCAHATCS